MARRASGRRAVRDDQGQSGHAIGGDRAGQRVAVTMTDTREGDGPAAAASASPAAAHFNELERLGQLHRQGILTDKEFAAEKARLLGE